MPRKNERRRLDRDGIHSAEKQLLTDLSVVGVRMVKHPERAGTQRRSVIDPSSFRCQRLASQLADQWAEIAAGKSRSVIEVHRQALDSYLSFVNRSIDSDVSLDETPDLVVATFDSWAKSLQAQYSSTSIMPYRLSSIVQSQMAAAVADKVITDPVLAAYACGHGVVPKPQAQPLDEFAKDEVHRLVLAARAHVRASRAIRRWATAIADGYRSQAPASSEVRYLGHLLTMVREGEPIAHQPGDKRLYSLRHLFPVEAWKLYRPRDGGTVSVVQWCHRAVLPSVIDCFPYRVLLLAGTGVAVDEIAALRVSDIEYVEDGVRIQMTKGRAGRSKGRFFPGSPDGGGWDVAGVMRSLLAFTESARSVSESQWRDRVWLSSRRKPIAGSDSRFSCVPTDFSNVGLTDWIESVQGICDVGDISLPHDMRRIRKSRVSQRAIELKGVMSDSAGDDHTTRVFFTHYAHTTTLQVYSAAIISSFQTALAEAVQTGFTAFLQSRSKVPPRALSEALPIDSERAIALQSGSLDMGVVDCRDPFASPFTQSGRLCAAAPLSCLMCENAVVFTDHLPNILALIASMERARTVLGPDEWITTWGAQYDAAQALIAALPNDVRDAAERASSAATTDLAVWMDQEFHDT